MITLFELNDDLSLVKVFKLKFVLQILKLNIAPIINTSIYRDCIILILSETIEEKLAIAHHLKFRTKRSLLIQVVRPDGETSGASDRLFSVILYLVDVQIHRSVYVDKVLLELVSLRSCVDQSGIGKLKHSELRAPIACGFSVIQFQRRHKFNIGHSIVSLNRLLLPLSLLGKSVCQTSHQFDLFAVLFFFFFLTEGSVFKDF